MLKIEYLWIVVQDFIDAVPKLADKPRVNGLLLQLKRLL